MSVYGTPLFGTYREPREGRRYFRTQFSSPQPLLQLGSGNTTKFNLQQLPFDMTSGNMSQITGIMVDNTYNPLPLYFVVQDTGFSFKARPHEFYQGKLETGALNFVLGIYETPMIGLSAGLFSSFPVNLYLLNFEPPTKRRPVGPFAGLGLGGYYAPMTYWGLLSGQRLTLANTWIVVTRASPAQHFPPLLQRSFFAIYAQNTDTIPHTVHYRWVDQANAIATFPAGDSGAVELPPAGSASDLSAVACVMQLQATEDNPITGLMCSLGEAASGSNFVQLFVSEWGI